MADGTRGGSTNAALDLIATDDLSSGTYSGQKAQVVKLGLGAGGAMEEIAAANPLPVTANAGTNLNTSALATAAKQPALGTAGTASTDVLTVQGIASGTPLVGAQLVTRISVTPTVSTSPAYTAKDAVGGLLTFSNAARLSGGTITVLSAQVIDNSQQRPSLELVMFDRTFTASTDNAIFAPSDGDLANTVGVISVNGWSDFSTNSVATVSNVGLSAKLNGTDLFGQLVTRGTPTFVATSDIIVILTIAQN